MSKSEQEFLNKANEFLNSKIDMILRRQSEDMQLLLESWKTFCVKALAEERAKIVKEVQAELNNKSTPVKTEAKNEEPANTEQKPAPKKNEKKTPQPKQQPPKDQPKEKSTPEQKPPKDSKPAKPQQPSPSTPSNVASTYVPVMPGCQYASELQAAEVVSAAILEKKPSVIVFTSLWNRRYTIPSNDKPELATFVIATDDQVNVLHMTRCSHMPKALTEILLSKEILKVGFQIDKDYEKLYKEFNNLYMVGAVELNQEKKKFNNLFAMGAQVLPNYNYDWINSPAREEDWGKVELSEAQTSFAYNIGCLTWNVFKSIYEQNKGKYNNLFDWTLNTRKPQF